MEGPLSAAELKAIDAYWRAANYLSVGQIYLLANPLLREPLQVAHVKPRLLGHWGTSPGLNFVYAHLNRVIIDRVPTLGDRAAHLKQALRDKLIEPRAYITTYGQDLPEIREWTWTEA